MSIKKLITSNIYLYTFVRKLLSKLEFLLPHEKDMLGLRELSCLKGGVFLDIGANDGVTAICFKKLVPSCRVISFEPNSIHEAALKNVESRFSDFSYELNGVSEEECHFKLYVPYYKDIALTSYAGVDKASVMRNLEEHMHLRKMRERMKFKELTVNMVNLNTRDDLEPALIKIDVEGHEYGVVKGVMSLVRKNSPVLFIEYNATSYQDCSEALAKCGYKPYCYLHDEGRFEEYTPGKTLNIFYLNESHLKQCGVCL